MFNAHYQWYMRAVLRYGVIISYAHADIGRVADSQVLLETLLDDPRILVDDIFFIPVASVVLAVRPDIASAVVTVHLLQKISC